MAGRNAGRYHYVVEAGLRATMFTCMKAHFYVNTSVFRLRGWGTFCEK